MGQGPQRVGAGDCQRVELRITQLVLDEESACGALVVLPLGVQARS
jgi:hypothetical protein